MREMWKEGGVEGCEGRCRRWEVGVEEKVGHEVKV